MFVNKDCVFNEDEICDELWTKVVTKLVPCRVDQGESSSAMFLTPQNGVCLCFKAAYDRSTSTKALQYTWCEEV